MKMTMGMDMVWNVHDVEDNGTAKVGQKIERIHFTMEGAPTGKIEFDSDSKTEPTDAVGKMMAPMFGAMVGAELTFNMDPRGHISDLTVPEKLTDAMKKVPGGGQAGFGPDQLKQMIKQAGVVLPEGSVSKGNTWSEKIDMQLPVGKMSGTNKMTYEGTVDRGGRQLQEILLKPDLTLKPDPKSPAKVEMKTQDAKGKLFFDNATGKLVETDMDQSMDMTTTFAGQEIAQKIKTKLTMKLSK